MRITYHTTKSRTLFDGELWINDRGSAYKFDQVAMVLSEDLQEEVERMAPGASRTTHIVYAIPPHITGEAWYKPAGSGSDNKIAIGYIAQGADQM